MKTRAVFGLVGGSLLVLSSLAHAFLGWPPLRALLEEARVDSNLIGALTIGWFFGSVAMLVFGVIVLSLGLRLWRGQEVDRWPAMLIAGAYIVFGFGAMLWRHLNPHFIGFVIIGVVVAFSALRIKRV